MKTLGVEEQGIGEKLSHSIVLGFVKGRLELCYAETDYVKGLCKVADQGVNIFRRIAKDLVLSTAWQTLDCIPIYRKENWIVLSKSLIDILHDLICNRWKGNSGSSTHLDLIPGIVPEGCAKVYQVLDTDI